MKIIKWLEDKGFVNDRSWKKEDKDGLNFYSFGKGDYRFEIKKDWNKKFTSAPYTNFMLSIFNCKDEWWGEPMNCLMWMGQKYLCGFDKEISKELFDEICKHYNID
jgi:hypothetical protein